MTLKRGSILYDRRNMNWYVVVNSNSYFYQMISNFDSDHTFWVLKAVVIRYSMYSEDGEHVRRLQGYNC